MTPFCVVFLHLALLPGASSACFAQDAVWTETQFSRVHLRNGNIIDGNLLLETEKSLHLLIHGAGILIIAKETILKLEAVKMRSFVDLPKVYVPKVAAPSDKPVQSPSARDKMLALAPPEISPAQREMIARILGKFLSAKTDQERGTAAEELASDRHLKPYLASMLPQTDTRTIELLRWVLEQSFDPETTPYLKAALESDNTEVLAAAISLLGGSGDKDQAAGIRRFLQSENPAILVAAITALCSLEDEIALDSIAGRMKHANDEVRHAAVNASLKLGLRLERMDFVVESLRDALPGAEGKVAQDLVSTAARTRRPELVEAIEPFLRSLDLAVRRSAADAFGKLAAAPAATPILVNRLSQEDDVPTRLIHLATAGRLQTLEAVPVIIDILRNSDADHAPAVGRALELITREKYGLDANRWASWWEQMHAAR